MQLAEVTLTLNIQKREQIFTFNLPGIAEIGEVFVIDVSSNSGLDVTYELYSGDATLSNDTLTVNSQGTVEIKFTQSGNDEYADTEFIHAIEVGKDPQTISFTLPDTVYVNDVVDLAATASSGLDVTFEIVSGTATITGSTFTATEAGTIEVKALQAGNFEYLAAEVILPVEVIKRDQVITQSITSTGDEGDEIILEASSDSGLDVMFEIISGNANN